MNKKIVFILVCSIILTGCGNVKENQIRNVEEVEIEEKTEVSVSKLQKETEAPETLNGVDKEMVERYIDDSHFYDEKNGVDFVYSMTDEKYHIAILDAWFTNDLAECGEYFIEESERIMKKRSFATEVYGVKNEDIIYLCVKIQLTSKENKETKLDIGYFFPYIRIFDNRLIEYNLADAYLDDPLVSTELCYDYVKKGNGKSYYFFDMQPGETTEPITMLYLTTKEKVTGDWYLELNRGTPIYNGKFRCNFPPDDEDVKFLKINLREENQ